MLFRINRKSLSLFIIISLAVILIVTSCSASGQKTEKDYDEILQGTWDYFRPAYEDPKIGHANSFGERLSFDEGTLIYVAYSEEEEIKDHKVVGSYELSGNVITTSLNDHEESFNISKDGDEYVLSIQYEGEDEPRIYRKISDHIQDNAYSDEKDEETESSNDDGGEITRNNSAEAFREAIKDYTDYGKSFMNSLNNVNELSREEKYERYQEADKYAAQMKEACSRIIDVCEGSETFGSIQYQFRLLRNMIPGPVTGSSVTEIADQTTLYSYLLQQMSSTSSYTADFLNYLSGKEEKSYKTEFYSEVPEMVTPDTAIYGITYDSYAEKSGVKQYTYILGEDESDAKCNYNIYLYALELDGKLKVEISDDTAIVYQNGKMVSAMMAGTDPEKGLFLTVSFK